MNNTSSKEPTKNNFEHNEFHSVIYIISLDIHTISICRHISWSKGHNCPEQKACTFQNLLTLRLGKRFLVIQYWATTFTNCSEWLLITPLQLSWKYNFYIYNSDMFLNFKYLNNVKLCYSNINLYRKLQGSYKIFCGNNWSVVEQ